jgi:hypothetical protein
MYVVRSCAMVLLLASCSVRNQSNVELPTTDVVALRPSWAVVVAGYVRLRETADTTAVIAGHLRAGDVARVVSIGLTPYVDGSERVRWIELSADGLDGWVLESDLVLFNNETQARNAASAMEQSATEQRVPGGDTSTVTGGGQ